MNIMNITFITIYFYFEHALFGSKCTQMKFTLCTTIMLIAEMCIIFTITINSFDSYSAYFLYPQTSIQKCIFNLKMLRSTFSVLKIYTLN